jgi:hypothetical protein
VEEMIRKADQLIAKHRRLIGILEVELGRKAADPHPEPSQDRRGR